MYNLVYIIFVHQYRYGYYIHICNDEQKCINNEYQEWGSFLLAL